MSIEYNILNMPNIRQTDNLCWAYCALMFEIYNRQKTTLCDILKIKEDSCCKNNFENINCNGEGFRVPFDSLNYTSKSSYNHIPEWQLIKSQINLSMPVVFNTYSYQSGNTSHYIIIKGYADFNKGEGKYLLINNPSEPDQISYWQEFNSILLNQNGYLNEVIYDVKKKFIIYEETHPVIAQLPEDSFCFYRGSESLEKVLLNINLLLNAISNTGIPNAVNFDYLSNTLLPSNVSFFIENECPIRTKTTNNKDQDILSPVVNTLNEVIGTFWFDYDNSNYYLYKIGKSRFEMEIQRQINNEIQITNFIHSTQFDFDAIIFEENDQTKVRINKAVQGINNNELEILNYKTFYERYNLLLNK